MNFRKLTIATVIAVLGAAFFVACGPRHHAGRDYSDRIVKKLDRVADRLDLEGDQERKYQELRGRVLADLKAGHQARLESMRTIRAEFEKAEPDIQAVAREVKAAMAQRHKRMEAAPDYAVEFYSILNAGQQAKVKKFVLDRLEDI